MYVHLHRYVCQCYADVENGATYEQNLKHKDLGETLFTCVAIKFRGQESIYEGKYPSSVLLLHSVVMHHLKKIVSYVLIHISCTVMYIAILLTVQ